MKKTCFVIKKIKDALTLRGINEIWKYKKLKVVLICWLSIFIILGSIASWKAVTASAMKIYPEIKFDNFAKQVEKGLVGGISLKYVADGKEVDTKKMILTK